MTQHLMRTLLLAASLLALPVPALPQATPSREPVWRCDRNDWYDDEPVTSCTLDREAGMCVVLARRAPGSWAYRVQTYTRGRPHLTEWSRNDTVIRADGTIVPHVRWWRAGEDGHGDVPLEEERERLRFLLSTFCRESGLAPELQAALRQVRAFAEETQTAQSAQPRMSRP